MKIKKLAFLLTLLTWSVGQSYAQNVRFKDLLSWMDFNYRGKTISDYKAYGESLKMKLIYEKDQPMEHYLVYGNNLKYSRYDDIEESFYQLAGEPEGIEFDLTPNRDDKYNAITITVVFRNQELQQAFRKAGLAVGCIENTEMDDTNFGLDWKNVTGIKYNAMPGILTTWRFVYFYEKDGMYMAQFQ